MIQSWEQWLINQSCAAIQRDLHRLEKWADQKSLTLCSSIKRNAVRNNPMHQLLCWEPMNWKAALWKGHPGPSEHNTECEAAMHPWGKDGEWCYGLHEDNCCHQVEAGNPSPLLNTVEALEYCIHFCTTQYNSDQELLERDQCRATKMVKVLEHSFYEERLSKMWLFSLEKTWLGEILSMYLNTWREGS